MKLQDIHARVLDKQKKSIKDYSSELQISFVLKRTMSQWDNNDTKKKLLQSSKKLIDIKEEKTVLKWSMILLLFNCILIFSVKQFSREFQ